MLSYLQQKYNIQGVVFSSSPAVIDYCKQQNLTFVWKYRTNRYGMPYVRNMLQTIHDMYEAQSYGYINSDILLSEVFIHTLSVVLERLSSNGFEVRQS